MVLRASVVIIASLAAASVPSMAQRQSFTAKDADATSSADHISPVGLTGNDIIEKMVERNRARGEQLQHYSAVRTYGRRMFTVDHEQYVVNPPTPLQPGTGEISESG